MVTITCDLCGDKIHDKPIRVTLQDGEHPHNGSSMTRTVDACGAALGCPTSLPRLSTAK